MAVKVFDSCANLVDVALYFKLVKAFASSEQFVQWLVLAQLKKDVNVLRIFEEVFEPDDVVVVQAAMNFDFGHQLLLCSALGKWWLENDFGSLHFFVVQVCKLVALGEASFAKEFTL